MRTAVAVALALFALGMALPALAQGVPRTKAVGLELLDLEADDLDAIQEETGHRVGVLVIGVKAGSAASKTGMKENDIILSVANRGVDSAAAVERAMRTVPGHVTVTVLRWNDQGGQTLTFRLAVPGAAAPKPPAVPGASGVHGLDLAALPDATLDAIQKSVGHRVGVRVAGVRAGSAAASAGFRPEDIVIGVGDQRVDSPRAVAAALAGKTGTIPVLVIRRKPDGGWATVALNLALSPSAPRPPTPAAPRGDADAIRAKLDALEQARAAGILSDAEYQAKKAELDAQLRAVAPAIDEATRRKLDALEQARAAGILDDAEYRRKKAELLGGRATGPAGNVGGTAPTPVATGDPVQAYFDMLDFTRSQAWGRRSVTPAATRQRATLLLRQSLHELDAPTRQAIDAIPRIWQGLQGAWAKASEPQRAEQRDYWRKRLLLPNQLLPPDGPQKTFVSEADSLRFDHPADWFFAQTKHEGSHYLFLAPPGTRCTWDQVLDVRTCPPAALLVVTPVDDEFRRMKTMREAARRVVQVFVASTAPDLKEISAIDYGKDATVLTLTGRRPGDTEDWFCWVGLVRFGPDHVVIGRFAGPVSRAEALLPTYCGVVSTLELSPPGAGGGDAAWFAAAAGSLGTTVVQTGWYAQNHGLNYP
jgi:hypothetical protein